MDRNNETIRLAKKAADAWRTTDTYHQAAQIIDMLISALESCKQKSIAEMKKVPQNLRDRKRA